MAVQGSSEHGTDVMWIHTVYKLADVTVLLSCLRTHMIPVRDDEAESQRKAKSRQARQTRRATQVWARHEEQNMQHYMLKLNYILFHMTSAFTLHFFRVLHFQSWWRQRKPSVHQSWTWDQMRCVDPLKESVFREENPALLHWCRISCLRNTRVSSWCGNIWMRWTQIQLLSNVFFTAIIQLHDGVIFVDGWRLFPRVHYVVSTQNMNS